MTGQHHLYPCILVAWVQRGLALYTIFYGLVLLLPANTFIMTPTFAAMARMMPEPAWGATLMVLGGGMLLPWSLPRRVMLSVSAALWLGLAVLAIVGNPTTPAWINFCGAAFVAGALAWRRA